MLITLGPNRFESTGTLHDVTWQQLTEWLRSHPRMVSPVAGEYATLAVAGSATPEGMRLANAKDGPWISFAAFEGNRRHLTTAQCGCAVPIDLDYSGLSLDAIRHTLAGYTWFAYTTFGHTELAPRWRIIVPVDGLLGVTTHRATWMALSSIFNGAADVAAKDISRLNYLPGACIDPAAAQYAEGNGRLFPVVPAPPEIAPAAPSASDGPVEGWCGPSDDTALLTHACGVRTRVNERFGDTPLLYALWMGDADYLGTRYPPKEPSQRWDHTQADLALCNELSYFTGRDRERVLRLALQAGCVTCRAEDRDEMARKLSYAVQRACLREEMYAWPAASTADPATAASSPTDTPPPAPTAVAGEASSATTPAAPAAPPVVGDIPAPPPMLHPEDFFSYLREHKYLYRPTRELWVASSLSGELRALVDIERPVHRLTWAPGMPERFKASTWDAADAIGAETYYYNLYRPTRAHTIEGDASPWLDLLNRLYPGDARHLVQWMADRVQNPGKKINHALVLGSRTHGIGKDTLLAPLQYAVGEQNYATITPARILSRFNGFRQSVVLQISESRNVGEADGGRVDRYSFYEAMKDLCAAPPSRLEVDTKGTKEYWVANVTGPVLTTNHQTDGTYLPPEDRRHYCAWSMAPKLGPETAKPLWDWYNNGGLDIVANYLSRVDLGEWDRAADPPRTDWWHELVNEAEPHEAAGLEDTLTAMGSPERLTIAELVAAADPETKAWLLSPAARKVLSRRLASAGYTKHQNPSDKRGRWFIKGVQTTVFRRS